MLRSLISLALALCWICGPTFAKPLLSGEEESQKRAQILMSAWEKLSSSNLPVAKFHQAMAADIESLHQEDIYAAYLAFLQCKLAPAELAQVMTHMKPETRKSFKVISQYFVDYYVWESPQGKGKPRPEHPSILPPIALAVTPTKAAAKKAAPASIPVGTGLLSAGETKAELFVSSYDGLREQYELVRVYPFSYTTKAFSKARSAEVHKKYKTSTAQLVCRYCGGDGFASVSTQGQINTGFWVGERTMVAERRKNGVYRDKYWVEPGWHRCTPGAILICPRCYGSCTSDRT